MNSSAASSQKVMESSLSELAQKRTEEHMQLLGIPQGEMTPAVRFAMSALIERLDDMAQEADSMREKLTELSELVDIDTLAPIANRRAFNRRLTWTIAMHERYGHPTTLLYIDLNDFKTINDTYGHTAGDVAIRHMVTVLSEMMRESDFIARIGGDEFAVIMYHADEKSAIKRGRKIMDTLQNTPFEYEGNIIRLSAAYGCYSIAKGDTAESALTCVDRAMYADKQSVKKRKIAVN